MLSKHFFRIIHLLVSLLLLTGYSFIVLLKFFVSFSLFIPLPPYSLILIVSILFFLYNLPFLSFLLLLSLLQYMVFRQFFFPMLIFLYEQNFYFTFFVSYLVTFSLAFLDYHVHYINHILYCMYILVMFFLR
jgi:hypothetical protein